MCGLASCNDDSCNDCVAVFSSTAADTDGSANPGNMITPIAMHLLNDRVRLRRLDKCSSPGTDGIFKFTIRINPKMLEGVRKHSAFP